MRIHWLLIAAKFILFAIFLKLLVVLLVLPLFATNSRSFTCYWRSLLKRMPV
jgi:hypothetical protein